jgi:hypothetical protein
MSSKQNLESILKIIKTQRKNLASINSLLFQTTYSTTFPFNFIIIISNQHQFHNTLFKIMAQNEKWTLILVQGLRPILEDS